MCVKCLFQTLAFMVQKVSVYKPLQVRQISLKLLKVSVVEWSDGTGILGVTIQSTGTSQVGTPYHLACQIGNSLTPSIGPVVYEWTSTCSGECFILRQPGIATASTQYLKAVDSGTHTCTVTDSVGNQGSASVNVSTTGKTCS